MAATALLLALLLTGGWWSDAALALDEAGWGRVLAAGGQAREAARFEESERILTEALAQARRDGSQDVYLAEASNELGGLPRSGTARSGPVLL
ncbi:MAG: hypothetical protein U0231_08985 [Nitrospiraceae bacterium]